MSFGNSEKKLQYVDSTPTVGILSVGISRACTWDFVEPAYTGKSQVCCRFSVVTKGVFMRNDFDSAKFELIFLLLQSLIKGLGTRDVENHHSVAEFSGDFCR